MSAAGNQYTIQATADDDELIEQLLEGSPFGKEVLLRVAMRIGLEAIKKDPMVLMPYFGKQMEE